MIAQGVERSAHAGQFHVLKRSDVIEFRIHHRLGDRNGVGLLQPVANRAPNRFLAPLFRLALQIVPETLFQGFQRIESQILGELIVDFGQLALMDIAQNAFEFGFLPSVVLDGIILGKVS
jgi:hypothetical protein